MTNERTEIDYLIELRKEIDTELHKIDLYVITEKARRAKEALRKTVEKVQERLKNLPKKPHGNIKCDCGHTQKDHYLGGGFCHDSKHPRAGRCGCTWFYPNVRYILAKRERDVTTNNRKNGKRKTRNIEAERDNNR